MPHSAEDRAQWLFPGGAATFIVITLILFTLAAGIRGLGIAKGPAEFQPVRQYFSMMIARYLQHSGEPGLSAEQRTYLENTRQPIHEPPVTEWLSNQGFKLTGGESLWLPRLITATAWLVGGVFLLLLLRRLVPPEAALAGTAFYLFLPFAIEQSLSIQPDSLMMASGLAGVYFILRHHHNPTRRNLIISGLVCALAITLKTQVVFLIAGSFAGLSLRRMPLSRLFLHGDSWLFGLLALTPPVLYLVGNMLFIGGIEAQRGIIPTALLSPHFYIAWLYLLEKAIGFPILVLGLLGLVAMRGDMRNLALGMWGGYALLGMLFTYHFATHIYYHSAVIPPIALGLAALSASLVRTLRDQSGAYVSIGLALAAILAIGLPLAQTARGFDRPGVEDKARVFAEIGEKVAHSNQVLMYAQSEGLPLMYHARVSGWLWPTDFHLAVERVGLKGISVGEDQAVGLGDAEIRQRLDEYRTKGARYFIASWMEDFQRHPELERTLATNYPRLAATADYQIYDLGTPLRATVTANP